MTIINLIPEGLLLAQTQRRRATRWAILVLATAGLSAAPLVVDWNRRVQAAELREVSDRLQQDLDTTRSQLRTTSAEATKVFLEVERAKALRSKRAWSGMFALIASCMPADCWLASVATDPETPPAAAPPPPSVAASPQKTKGDREIIAIEAPRKLRLVGYAEDDTQPLAFVTRLKESRVFQSVLLERAFRAPDAAQGPSDPSDRAVYQFEVVCQW